ncbi:MAG: hypothetical protein QXX08_00160 [Candidatus Bathyarchaeia archaeon]
METVTNILVRFLLLWVLAGFIVMLGNLSIISWTGGLEGLPPGLLMNLVLENAPFPFNLIVTGYFNPIFLIANFVVFISLITLIETRKKIKEHPLPY